jgi:hypothetical protein
LQPTITPLPVQDTLAPQNLPGFGYGPSDFPASINPLTGLEVYNPGLLARRPMLVKISNFPRQVRPQWGLNTADHIFEYYLEFGLTRFAAVFYGQDADRVGPVRSARLFDEHLVRMYKAIFAFGYADDPIIDRLTSSEFRNLLVIEQPDNCPPMCRMEDGAKYNDLFTNTWALSQFITERGGSNESQNLDGLRFEANNLAVLSAAAGEHVTVRYSSSSYHLWRYEPGAQRYYRWQDADNRPIGDESYMPLMDNLSESQVFADNLVIVMATTEDYYRSSSTEIFTINLTGQGLAYAFRDGKVFRLTWKRPEPSALLTLEFYPGKPYPLKPGNVWYIILGETSSYRQSDPISWEFGFSMP